MAHQDMVAPVQEGSRWLHNPPSGADFAAWFAENVPMHEGLHAEEYVNGVVLIPNKEKRKVTRQDSQGNPAIVEVEHLSFAPYPQVETRVRYFWEWCRVNDYLGEIEPVTSREQSASLPQGVFLTKIQGLDGKPYTFLNATFQVRVYKYDARTGGKGRPIMLPPPADKTVNLHGRFGPDVNAAMRARTGAIGRALGFAGMLVVPGAGISSAEDMQDHLEGVSALPQTPGAAPTTVVEVETAPAAVPADAPAVETGEDELRAMVRDLTNALKKDHEEVWAGIEAWASERDLDLAEPPAASLRSLEKQLRRKLAAAVRDAAK